jgi:hypothetical protein
MEPIQQLSQALQSGKVPPRDREFAGKLVEAHRNGRLTFNMAQWVPRILERVTAPPTTVKVGGVVALLAKAKASGLKHPKLWLRINERTPLRITVAGGKSKSPGYLMLTDGQGFGNGLYFGKISPDGELVMGQDGYAVRPALEQLLRRLADTPAEVAAEFGRITGHCCFCSLTLSDERSVSVGYGPICAEKWGVPWGEGKKPKRRHATA